jgi:tRNA (guanine-N7-)-methyltransferase
MQESRPDLRPEHKDKPIRSYVVRAGRMTDAQRKAFDSQWAVYGLSLFDGAVDWQQVFGRKAPVVLEIGFGMGDSLLAMALAEPDKDFVGVEVHPPGVGRLINNAAKAGVKNLRVYLADAVDVLNDCVADSSLQRVQIYFPDPWHKKKHNKRRIVQPGFVDLLRAKLETGGLLHMATDWQPYAQSMLEVMGSVEGFGNESTTGDYIPRPAFRPATKFEKRGERLGHGVWDLLFCRHR